MNELAQQVRQALEACGIPPGDRPALVAVSGGVDSMVLLQLLTELAPPTSWRLTVAHFNHRLRGRSSDADERLVKRRAAALGLKCVTGRANVRALARQNRCSLEMAARLARHAFLVRTAKRLRVHHVFLAQHADDQVELFFLRLLRGAGNDGLAGMRVRGPSPADPAIELVRPLLGVPKSTLLNYARARSVIFREDASNANLDALRNRIRNELLPLLRSSYQPGLSATVGRSMEIAGAEADFVRQAADDWLCESEKSRPAFSQLAVAVQRRCLEAQLVQRGIAPEFQLVEHLRLHADQPYQLARDLRSLAVSEETNRSRSRPLPVHILRTSKGELEILRAPARPAFDSAVRVLNLRGRSGHAAFGGRRFHWSIVSGAPGLNLPIRPEIRREYFDADAVGSVIRLRHWRAGDRFWPIGMKAPVKLQDLFVNRKVPRHRRHELIVAESEQGEIFWVEELRISERFKLREATKRRLHWMWRRR